MSDSEASSTSFARKKDTKTQNHNKTNKGPVDIGRLSALNPCVHIQLTQYAANTRRKGKRKQIDEEEDSNDSDDLDNESVEVLKARHTRTRQSKKRRVNNKINQIELAEGQELVGVVVEAPKTGLVPPGQISKNTLNFLGKLNKLEYNNRAW